jgi:hypothetical protein
MLNKNSVIIRLAVCFSCFLLSGTETITGWPATLCGVFGTIQLATALLRYSPINDLKAYLNIKAESPQIVTTTFRRTRILGHNIEQV